MEWSGQPEQSSAPATAESEPICSIPHKDHALETAGGNPSVFTSTRFSILTMRVQIFVTRGHEPRGAQRVTHRAPMAGRISGLSVRFRGLSGRERAEAADTMSGMTGSTPLP